MAQLDLAIVGGEVVNADGVARADVGIADGRIAAVVAPGTMEDSGDFLARVQQRRRGGDQAGVGTRLFHAS